MKAEVFDDRPCSLGEGPLWHPGREEFFWFDINNCRMHADRERTWAFDGNVSAAGWVDDDFLLIAGERALMLFNIEQGGVETICPLEADNPLSRSNDGRADPLGGFWIGTMAKDEATETGAIYRYYKGEIRRLFEMISIPNSICFSPDGLWAYWTDTRVGTIWKQAISDTDGWPVGEPVAFADPKAQGWNPDGSVVDASGNLWNAQYGGARIAAYRPDGSFWQAIDLPAQNPTCPAFGGSRLDRLFCTSAHQHLEQTEIEGNPLNGQTFVVDGFGPGQKEHQIILG